MCGCFVQSSRAERFARPFGIEEQPKEVAARYNIAPTQSAWVCGVGRDGRRSLQAPRFGLVPHWSQGSDSRYSMINARGETVHQKPAYRDAFRLRRCLIPADAFYEWQRTDGKQPYCIRRRDGEPLAFAGVWDHWRGADGKVIDSFAIITTAANRLMTPIHDRIPVILDSSEFERWLDPDEHVPCGRCHSFATAPRTVWRRGLSPFGLPIRATKARSRWSRRTL